ncbi:MAG TPA: DUF4038 domain-containing protein [Bryobacteraceae bacterium]|jgi:hypothetical protein
MLKYMLCPGLCCLALTCLTALTALSGEGASLPSCSEGARNYLPCELAFPYQPSELPPSSSPYRNELLNVEFRSPNHVTYLMREFAGADRTLRVRFTPIEAGTWTYKVTSSIARYDNQEHTFNVAESDASGMVNVANLRHWRSSNKKPHLWLSAAAPFLQIDPANFETWLDARKHDGFTHIRGTLLTLTAADKPLTADAEPNPSYFAALDDRILPAAQKGFTVDLLLAGDAFVHSGALNNREQLDPLFRYLVARYGGLNVTWQGIEHFEDVPGSRSLLKDFGALLQKYDGFQHPRSTDARVSSSPLLPDGWMNYLIEASPDPQFAAVEHQFTQQPEIHVINATDPDSFRHELWNAATNGEYPSVSYESLRNEANVKAIQTWARVLADTRHWELEPYFDVDGARAIGLDEVEYLAYAQSPGIVEINLPKHKYNPDWVNPISGEEIPLKDYRGEVFSRPTPDNAHDWVLEVPREGHKESMLRYYYFESQDPPVQEVETDPAKAPFELVDPPGDAVSTRIPTPFKVKITRANRASRSMQYVWWGEVVAGGAGPRVLALGANGTFTLPAELANPGSDLNLRVLAINAFGKAYELDKVYRLTP